MVWCTQLQFCEGIRRIGWHWWHQWKLWRQRRRRHRHRQLYYKHCHLLALKMMRTHRINCLFLVDAPYFFCERACVCLHRQIDALNFMCFFSLRNSDYCSILSWFMQSKIAYRINDWSTFPCRIFLLFILRLDCVKHFTVCFWVSSVYIDYSPAAV